MSRQFKVTESERSPIIVSALWKQKVNLERDLRILESNKQLVVNRITLNQKIMIKAFKKKLYQAKLSHARIFGDREAEKSLRHRSEHMGSHFHTNLGLDPEDEEILKKIWSRGRRTPEAESSESKRLARRSTYTKSAPVSKRRNPTAKYRNNNRTEVLSPRPQTVCTTHPRLHTNSSLYVCTGHQVECDNTTKQPELSPQTNTTEAAVECSSSKEKHVSITGAKTPSPNEPICDSARTSPDGDKIEERTTNVIVVEEIKEKDNDRISTSTRDRKSASARTECRSEGAAATNVFEEDNRHERLLEIQRQRIRSANYEQRVKRLCSTLTPYVVPKDQVVQDYYQCCMVEDSRAMRGHKVSGYRTPVIQEAEIRKSIGNLGIRSMTLKRLSYNFGDNRTGR